MWRLLQEAADWLPLAAAAPCRSLGLLSLLPQPLGREVCQALAQRCKRRVRRREGGQRPLPLAACAGGHRCSIQLQLQGRGDGTAAKGSSSGQPLETSSFHRSGGCRWQTGPHPLWKAAASWHPCMGMKHVCRQLERQAHIMPDKIAIPWSSPNDSLAHRNPLPQDAVRAVGRLCRHSGSQLQARHLGDASAAGAAGTQAPESAAGSKLQRQVAQS